MPAPYEMKKLYAQNKIGEFEYGECEYIHNCEPIWPSITYGIKDHWRNNMYSTYYCTHSLGPIIHATGLRPVSVIGLESANNKRREMGGGKGADLGIEIVTLENGAIVKSIHGGLYENSVWYSMYGSKGRMESAREETGKNDVKTIFVKCDVNEGDYAKLPVEEYRPARPYDDKARAFGHGSSDFYCMWHFVEKIKGNPEADIIDVYEALDMFLPGMFAFRSILNGSVPTEIPNLRNKEEREKWKNDTACTDPKVAGDMLLPTRFGGTPDIPDSVYEAVKQKWDEECASDNPNNYRAMIYKKGEGK
jgi:predicted dehydrogenase